ncbi:MAG: hypothetical protein GY798_00045 [Hyphomicrobiales bacterium]|nr:hypothetical protein [Hyphomicrobiales bacterium]
MFADETLWADAGILVLQKEILDPINIAAAAAARERGLRICLNAAPARPLPGELVSLVDIIVVNAIEAEVYSGVAVEDLASAGRAADALAQTYPAAIVTAGGHGLATAAQDGAAFCLPAKNVELVSTHGAGDVFVGTLCAALAGGDDLRAACETANARAAEHVVKPTGQ